MVVLYIVPKWFVTFSITLELAFALISFLVFLYSFRVYRLSQQRELKFLGISFALFSISYILKSLLNAFVVSQLNGEIRTLALNNLQSMSLFGLYAQILLFITGLVTLVYATLKTKDYRTYTLLLFISLLVIILGENKAISFYIISSLLLFFICLHYLINCKLTQKPKTFLVFIAFVILLISSLEFIFATRYYLHYVFAHILELLAYSLVLTSLILTIKHEQKKK